MLHRTTWWPIVLILSLLICGLTVSSCLAAASDSRVAAAVPDETADPGATDCPRRLQRPVQSKIRELAPAMRMASTQAFAADDVLSALTVSGSIGYFTTHWDPLSTGETPRFLGGEHLTITVTLSQPLSRLQVDWAGETMTITGYPGRLRYELDLYLPSDRTTLSWHNERLRPAWPLTLTGTVYFGGTERVWQPGALELTGRVEDCLTISPWWDGPA